MTDEQVIHIANAIRDSARTAHAGKAAVLLFLAILAVTEILARLDAVVEDVDRIAASIERQEVDNLRLGDTGLGLDAGPETISQASRAWSGR